MEEFSPLVPQIDNEELVVAPLDALVVMVDFHVARVRVEARQCAPVHKRAYGHTQGDEFVYMFPSLYASHVQLCLMVYVPLNELQPVRLGQSEDAHLLNCIGRQGVSRP